MKKHIHKFTPLGFRTIDQYPNTSNPSPLDYLIQTCKCGKVKKTEL